MSQFLRRIFPFLHLMGFFSTLIACTGVQFPDDQSWQKVKLSDMSQVTGEWEGVTWAEPRTGSQNDWVKVRISEDGHFEFSSYRTIGAWLGSGNLRLENGQFVTELQPDSGSATFALYESRGKRMLKVKGRTKTGHSQVAELTPAKK